MKIFFIVIVVVLILLLIIYINHQIHLKEETVLRLPLGQMVEVDGHNMSIYVVGLMAVPEYYDSMNIKIPIMHIAGWAANIGVTRFIPGISDSDAIKHGILSDDEKEIYRDIFYSRTATVTMLNEVSNRIYITN